MGLRIWLPLRENLDNLGSMRTTIIGNNVAIDNNGKIGKSYSFDGSSSYIQINDPVFNNNTTEFSYACWFKPNVVHIGCLFCNRVGTNNTGITIWYYNNNIYFDTGVRLNFAVSPAITVGEWNHLAFTWKQNQEKKVYLNGNLIKETTQHTASLTTAEPLHAYVGAAQSNSSTTAPSGTWLNGYLNDVRIYDHCLSAAEVRELSQGLVAHYKLDNIRSTNLIKNGFGELGTENWSDSTKFSNDVPTADANIKQSVYSQNTIEQIPIFSNHSYQFSCYLKSTANSGKTYPALAPYDIDKQFISNFQIATGFVDGTATTLAQNLNIGDTVIYATSLANWPDHTNNRYVAIFSYKDSQGNIYPDLEYTRNTIRYGTSTKLNKTNNTITLPSAYAGPAVPAGTTICQAVAGDIYWYPFGGIAKSTLSNWTYKTTTFSPKDDARTKYAHYFTYFASDSTNDVLQAGMKLLDTTYSSEQLVDSSGYNNHGIITGILTHSNNTPRYAASTFFNGTSYALTPVNNMDWYTLDKCTLAYWVKPTVSISGYGGSFGIAADVGATYKSFSLTINDNIFKVIYTKTSYATVTSEQTLPLNEWHHCAVTLNDTTVKLYFDGALVKTATINWSTATYPTASRLQLGVNLPGTDEKFTGCYSDARFYTTVLSDDDIKFLYNTNLIIDNKNRIHTYQLNENLNNRELLFPNLFTSSYNEKNNLYTGYNNNQIYLAGYSSIGSKYIQINPVNHIYYFDVDLSSDAGNKIYIGFERYDKNKTSRTNHATIYPIDSVVFSTAVTHYHYSGIVDLSTDGFNPTDTIRLRILNAWGTNLANPNAVLTVHHLSLREVISIQQPQLQKNGIFVIDQLKEMQDPLFYNTGFVETDLFIEQ